MEEATTDMQVGSARAVWDAKVEVERPAEVFRRLGKAGLPLAEQSGVQDADETGTASSIVALVSIREGSLNALLATPSGLIYRFEPVGVDKQWWSFAARYYYIVTGNLADRKCLASLADVDIKSISGKTCSRKKDQEMSGMTIEAILNHLAPPELVGQAALAF